MYRTVDTIFISFESVLFRPKILSMALVTDAVVNIPAAQYTFNNALEPGSN